MSAAAKPKLLYFQWNHRPLSVYGNYMLTHTEEHVKALSHHFDVIRISSDVDFARVCDRHEPDLALFESGYQLNQSRRPCISNVRNDRSVPKLALFNADSWSHTRSGFLSDMDDWQVDDFFSICTTQKDYLPPGTGGFVWPNFFDPAVFRDYGCAKSIPVILTGQRYELYPWRKAVFGLLSKVYPCLVCPTFGYTDGLASRSLSGESYARALNASMVAPSCGTVMREVVRKHFEIPASKCCLIAERTPSLVAAGFVHMENCAFVDESDVLDVVEHLFRNPDELARVTQSGYEMVHDRHTYRHRPQIHQWLMLKKSLRPGQEIIQQGPFGSLVAAGTGGPPAPVATATGLDRRLLARGQANLSALKVDKAADDFSACLAYCPRLSEALLGLALCDLERGDAEAAATRLRRQVEVTTIEYGATRPDPIEWAYFIVALVCSGHLDEAASLIGWYPDLSHVELDNVRRALILLGVCRDERPSPKPNSGRPSRSLHDVASRDFKNFMDWFGRLVSASGNRAPLIRLGNGGEEAGLSRGRATAPSHRTSLPQRLAETLDALLVAARLDAIRPNVPPRAGFDYLGHVRTLAKTSLLKSPTLVPIRKLRKAGRVRQEIRRLRNEFSIAAD